MKKTMIPMFLSIVASTSMVNGTAFAAQQNTEKEEMVQMIDASFNMDLSNLTYDSTKKGVMTFTMDQYEVEVTKNNDEYSMSLYSTGINEALEKAGVSRTPIKTTTYTVEEVVEETKKEEAVVEVKEEDTLNQRILEAAKAQLGVNQDCTMLVTNSLAAVGINFHGAPEEYASLGEWTNNPEPGDIIIYSGHVAIYAGDGMAVHGGWNGYTTAMFSVNCSSPFIGYIHVSR